MRPKKLAENLLRRWPPLFRLAARAYHRFQPGFRTWNTHTPAALRRAFELALENREPQQVGDYYEFGLYRGYTFLTAHRIVRDLELPHTRLWGFDSFEGLPDVENEDAEDHRFFRGQFACSRAHVERNLTRRGMDWSRAKLIEGYYDQSLTPQLKDRHPFRPASVVLLDCDLYVSTRQALAWLADLLDDRVVILFDDWYAFGGRENAGQPRAWREFLADHPDWQVTSEWEYPHNGRVLSLERSRRSRAARRRWSPAVESEG
jgi:O-methyltransferase